MIQISEKSYFLGNSYSFFKFCPTVSNKINFLKWYLECVWIQTVHIKDVICK